MHADLALAIIHHLLVFALFGLLAAEAVLLRPGLSGERLALLARVDGLYGGVAAAIVMVGIGRVIWGLKGWEYYAGSWSFWAKMTAFAAVGIASIPPTLRILAWRRAARLDAGHVVPEAEIASTRRVVTAEIALFTLVLAFAATMARGIGT